jgi:hypothetical protein
MLVGVTPFEARNRQQLYWNIAHADLVMPDKVAAPAQGLMRGLLTRDPQLRLGAWDEVPLDIMEHAYFDGMDWDDLQSLKITPPWIPQSDKEYLDKEFVGKTVHSLDDDAGLDSAADKFDGFTFVEKMPLSSTDGPE